MANQDRWCFAWFVEADPSQPTAKGAILKMAKWPENSTVRVAFVDGPLAAHKTAFDKACGQVREYAREWFGLGRANLELMFVKDTPADIRVSFLGGGSWSMIGTTARNSPRPNTMNFSWPYGKLTEAQIRGEVLHEFGHALGLIHEHQSPPALAEIVWNKPQINTDLSGPPWGWTMQDIEINVFRYRSPVDVDFTKQFDSKSIMIYPIPVKWTLNGFYTDWILDFSELDLQFISEQYP